MWQAIKNLFSKLFGKSAPALPCPEQAPAPAPAPVVAKPEPQPVPAPAPKPAPVPYIIKKGDSGDAVITLQRRLIELLYAAGMPTGKFDSSTDNAVRSFQADFGLDVDGLVGPLTQAALATAKTKPAPVSSPVAAPSSNNDLVQALLDAAEKYQGVHEQGGYNRGQMVDAWNKAIGVPLGSSWCMSFAQAMIKEVCDKYKVKTQVHRSAGCQDVWDKSPDALKHKDPQPGDLIIWRHSKGGGGHVGIVMSRLNPNSIQTIEGNTSAATHVESNGDGVYVKSRSTAGSGDMKVVGYLTVFPK